MNFHDYWTKNTFLALDKIFMHQIASAPSIIVHRGLLIVLCHSCIVPLSYWGNIILNTVKAPFKHDEGTI